MENKKILVVDDDKKDLEKIKSILEKENYEIVVANNGAEAIDFLDKNGFDLILVDILMPTLSGYDLLRLLKERTDNKIKMAYITVVPKKEVDLEDLDGFIQKPFSPKSLVGEVKKLL
jgi:CheY-like chemotaxis protein